ncbi:hypothetical protein FQA39_LY01916 [Lamprigera yunnana]|nr:hypothetical protein FQA39_LY01916 [Lamprigera yunnana]
MFPLSTYYNQELKAYRRNKPNKIIELSDVRKIFGKAFSRAATLANADSGFKTTRIYPFDPHKFRDDMFVPSSLTERQDTAVDNPGASSQVGFTAVNNPGPSPSTTIKTSDALIDEQNIDTHLSHVTPQKKLTVTPANLLPLPKVIPQGKKNKEKQTMASTPSNRNTMKRKLSETTSLKSIKTRKRNTSNSSDSELSNIELCQNSSDNNSNFIGSPDSDNVDDANEPLTLFQSEILVYNFVLVPMTDQKNKN